MGKTISATVLLSVLFLSSILPGCHSHRRSTEYSYVIPKQLPDGLPVGAMYKEGMDTGKIVTLTTEILADSFPNIHSLLICRHGKLIYENYFAGEDVVDATPVGYLNHTMDDLHDCRSISKSVTSACFGIAIKQGFIKSIDEPILPYFREYAKYFDSAKRKITIRNLLTMTSGLEWDESNFSDPKNPYFLVKASKDPIAFILSRKIVSTPGTSWNYNSGNTQLLGEILFKATGEQVDVYAAKNLFVPLGISNHDWRHISNNNDRPAAGWGLRLRSRDLIKFGLLYMNNGKWGDTQIIDSDWVKQSLSAQVARPSENPNTPRGYGFQFWTDLLIQGPYKTDIPWATGYAGQLIFFWRSMDILVVFTGWNDNFNKPNGIVAFYLNIVPSVREMQPYFNKQ